MFKINQFICKLHFVLLQTTTDNFSRTHQPSYRTSHRTKDPYHCNHHCAKHSGPSDTDTYYEYYPDCFFQPPPTKKEFSDDSGSTRLPHYEEVPLKKQHVRNASYDRKTQQVSLKNGKVLNSVLVHKDVRRVYPNQEECLYHEVLDPR